jgi:beta-aspartyl-peptidase (threonine type)
MPRINNAQLPPEVESHHDVVLAVHGGAGVMTRGSMTAAVEKNFLSKLEGALKAGFKHLKKGGSSVDAVEAAVRYLEDCPVFNAGRGAVLTSNGRIELDASIMDGASGLAGAVACVTTVKNPVSCARAVMERTHHVLLAGSGAEQFAQKQKLEIVDPSYFITDRQWEKFERFKSAHEVGSNGNGKSITGTKVKKKAAKKDIKKYGTVGAVARDNKGNLAAATSTGGIIGQKFGRVGDSPIVGAGVYADNATCAVSSTGQGEYFMRSLTAYDVAALMKYAGMPVAQAAYKAIHISLTGKGAQGGIIVLDAKGECVMPFNSEGMFRGCITKKGEVFTSIYR